jgi:hypothetical protein
MDKNGLKRGLVCLACVVVVFGVPEPKLSEDQVFVC